MLTRLVGKFASHSDTLGPSVMGRFSNLNVSSAGITSVGVMYMTG